MTDKDFQDYYFNVVSDEKKQEFLNIINEIHEPKEQHNCECHCEDGTICGEPATQCGYGGWRCTKHSTAALIFLATVNTALDQIQKINPEEAYIDTYKKILDTWEKILDTWEKLSDDNINDMAWIITENNAFYYWAMNSAYGKKLTIPLAVIKEMQRRFPLSERLFFLPAQDIDRNEIAKAWMAINLADAQKALNMRHSLEKDTCFQKIISYGIEQNDNTSGEDYIPYNEWLKEALAYSIPTEPFDSRPPYISQRDQISRKIRPTDAVKLQPFTKKLPLWTQTNLTKMVLDVATSKPDEWTLFDKRNGYLLKTDSGIAILENIGTFDNLQKILVMLGPEGLQYTLATLAHMEETIRRKYGTNPPDSILGITPIKIVVSDLLRTMGRKPKGNTFEREQQMRPRQFLKAQSLIDYADIKPTKNGRPKMTVGPLITINGTEFEPTLPFDDIPDNNEVISIIVTPGPVVYDLMRKGIRWCHPQLIKYHPINQKFEIAIGFYIQQLAVNKRGKHGQDYVSIRAIERGSGVDSFDSNPRRRMQKITRALHRLAKDGLIPGKVNSRTNEIQAIFTQDKKISQLDAIESVRETMVKIVNPEPLPNGYNPLNCTTI